MGNPRTYLISQIVKYSQKLDQKGYGANHDGNASVKLDGSTLLATPTAVSKGDIVADIIITLDMEGKKIDGIGNPFSEIKLHLAAYRARNDIKAVIHAHPPFATARGLLGLPLKPALPEAIVSIGDLIPVVDFAMPGAAENDAIIANAVQEYDVFMMPGNGVFSTGDNLEQAYLRLELVEHLSQIYYYANAMGTPMELATADVTKLLAKRASIGLGPQGRKPNTPSSTAPTSPTNSAQANLQFDTIKTLIAEEIKKAIS